MTRMLRALAAAGLGPAGPAGESVATSLRRAFLVALIIWNLVLAGVVTVVEPRVSSLAMMALHLVLAGVCIAALAGFVPFDICVVLAFCVWMTDYLVARSVDDGLTLAACWLGDLLYATCAIALRNRARTWLPILGSIGVVAVIVNANPIWDVKTASAFVVTAIAIAVTARFAMPALWGLADEADAAAEALQDERRTEALVERTSAAAAEDARVLHDTVINTLSAVANSGRHIPMIAAMRERCWRDLAVVEQMLAGRREQHRDFTRLSRDFGRVRVERTGLTDSDLNELGDLLTDEAVDAAVGAVGEALRNVGKHAGVENATVNVSRSASAVRIEVIDHGSGFDPGAGRSGHGLTDSIFGRVEAVGGEVALTSEVGRGTELVISLPLRRQTASDSVVHESTADAADVAQGLVRRASWLLSVGIVVVGVLIELGNRPGELTWTYGMLVLVSLCIATSYAAVRRLGRLPWPIAAALCVAASGGFVAGMAGIDFGRTHVMTYQAIGIVPIMVILLAAARLRWVAIAVSCLIATGAVTAAVAWQESGDRGVIVIVGLLPAVGLGIGWFGFQRLVQHIVEESERSRWSAFVASVDSAVQLEIAEARQRWGTASLERGATLLEGIGSGRLDPGDPDEQDMCAAEERYLRQFLLLNPKSYRMSVWFAHALAAARSRGIQLVIRSGDEDAPDNDSAELVGGLVLGAVSRAPSGAEMTVSWFPTHEGPRLSIVGPITSDDLASARQDIPASWTVVREVLLDRQMVEVVVA